MKIEVKIGDIFLVTDLTNTNFTRHWYSSNATIEFKTKTTKPVIYIVMPHYCGSNDLDLWPLNPKSQFKDVEHTAECITFYGNREEDWKEVWNSLRYLGTVEDEELLNNIKNDHYNAWSYLDRVEKDLYKRWSQVAKDKGFKEEPVEDWQPKGQHLEFALDFIGQEVRVGDTVAYVNLGYGQELQTASVQSITKDNFVLESLWTGHRGGQQARPHNYVIKVDPSKVRK